VRVESARSVQVTAVSPGGAIGSGCLSDHMLEEAW